MKCLDCGADLVVSKGTHHYCKHDGVDIVLDGVHITRCSGCGKEGVAIPRIAELNRILVKTIAQRTKKLTPGEIRFLRKYLGWSGVDFAEHFGVTPETVSRWEHGAKNMGPTAERLLRLCALNLDAVEEYPLPKMIEEGKSETLRLLLSKSWRVSA